MAHCSLANPLPVSVGVDYQCVVRGHYLEQAGRDAARIALAPHSRVTRDVPFKLTADNPAYSIHATLKAVNPPDLQGPVLAWPAMDSIPFFPGLRHLVSWTSPYEYADYRRVNFRRPAGGLRGRMALCGDWDSALTRDLEPPIPAPTGLKFQPLAVPPMWGGFSKDRDPKAQGCTCGAGSPCPRAGRRGPRESSSNSVSNEGTIYVNGQKIGNVRGYGAPLTGEATAALHAGENEIVLVIRDVTAIMDPLYLNKDNPVASLSYMDAPGNCNGELGMGGSVWLESSPQVEAREIKVDTSVRNKKIAAAFTLANNGKEQLRARVQVTVQDARQPVLTVGQQEVTLAAGQTQDLAFSADWADPRLWSWKQPNLYVLAVEVTDVQSGNRLDLARERFGFRECRLEGDKIVFNGQPIKLNGVANGSAFSNHCDSTLSRNTMSLDMSDETGGLATNQITGLTNTPSKHNVDRDAYWQVTQANAFATIKRQWNHPCLIAWDLSNEWHHYAPYSGADMNPARGGSRRSATPSASWTRPAGRSATATTTLAASWTTSPRTTCWKRRLEPGARRALDLLPRPRVLPPAGRRAQGRRRNPDRLPAQLQVPPGLEGADGQRGHVEGRRLPAAGHVQVHRRGRRAVLPQREPLWADGVDVEEHHRRPAGHPHRDALLRRLAAGAHHAGRPPPDDHPARHDPPRLCRCQAVATLHAGQRHLQQRELLAAMEARLARRQGRR